jgi:hypothetical protein
MTVPPQENPTPKPTSITLIPGRKAPSLIASYIAMGMLEEMVLPISARWFWNSESGALNNAIKLVWHKTGYPLYVVFV